MGIGNFAPLCQFCEVFCTTIHFFPALPPWEEKRINTWNTDSEFINVDVEIVMQMQNNIKTVTMQNN